MPPDEGPSAANRREWLHEIKHDGFRVIARKAGTRVRLSSRPGNDLTARFPLIVEALALLKVLWLAVGSLRQASM
jgi:bifunctional non-homologous end joining protein LigD